MKQDTAQTGKICANRRRAFWLIILPVLLLPCFLLTPAGFSPAEAQYWQQGQSRAEPQPKRSFWDKLFGRHKQQDYNARRPSETRPAAPPAPRKTAPAKNADARRVLVIGDFTAAALADALSRAYSDNPNILIRSKTEGNSGLSRASAYDWPANIQALSAREKPALIILMLGANDKPPPASALPAAEAAPAPQAEAQAKAYQARIAALTLALQKSGAAWLWVGLPSFKDEQLNDGAMALNKLYARAAEQAGGHFVSTAAGFVDDKGNFALSGYDVDGRPARLRANDGINFTPAGRRKLAFYAMQAIELLWGDTAAEALPDASGTGKLRDARLAPVNPLDIGFKPALAGGDVFAPNPQARKAANNTETPRQNVAGRADNFSRSSAARAPALRPEP